MVVFWQLLSGIVYCILLVWRLIASLWNSAPTSWTRIPLNLPNGRSRSVFPTILDRPVLVEGANSVAKLTSDIWISLHQSIAICSLLSHTAAISFQFSLIASIPCSGITIGKIATGSRLTGRCAITLLDSRYLSAIFFHSCFTVLSFADNPKKVLKQNELLNLIRITSASWPSSMAYSVRFGITRTTLRQGNVIKPHNFQPLSF